jgi:ATP-dependent Lon protease
LAARRVGIHTVILPALNEPDLTELPEELRRDMKFVPVENLEQELQVAMSNGQA